jgi:hypothetical protein
VAVAVPPRRDDLLGPSGLSIIWEEKERMQGDGKISKETETQL